jgi:hypothetical protein
MGTQAVGRIRFARRIRAYGWRTMSGWPTLAMAAGGASPLVPLPGILERRRICATGAPAQILVYK